MLVSQTAFGESSFNQPIGIETLQVAHWLQEQWFVSPTIMNDHQPTLPHTTNAMIYFSEVLDLFFRKQANTPKSKLIHLSQGISITWTLVIGCVTITRSISLVGEDSVLLCWQTGLKTLPETQYGDPTRFVFLFKSGRGGWEQDLGFLAARALSDP